MKRRWHYLAGAALVLLALVGCGPEAGRARGQLGADVNNKVVVGDGAAAVTAPAPIVPNSKVWNTQKP